MKRIFIQIVPNKVNAGYFAVIRMETNNSVKERGIWEHVCLNNKVLFPSCNVLRREMLISSFKCLMRIANKAECCTIT